jgi:precorrin-6x reductase
MLEAVGHPFAVNPDRELAKVAKERGWEVLAFERPVTIRTRLAELPRPTPVVSGAALAGAIGSLALYWLLKVRRT